MKMGKINFTEKEKNDILTIINRYKEISTSVETLIKSITEIQNNINEYEDEMERLKSKENEKYLDCIKYVNKCLSRLRTNCNFDMSIDNMLLNLWEEVN